MIGQLGMSPYEARFLPPIPSVFPRPSISSRPTMSPRSSLCLAYEILPHNPGAGGSLAAALPVCPAAQNRDTPNGSMGGSQGLDAVAEITGRVPGAASWTKRSSGRFVNEGVQQGGSHPTDSLFSCILRSRFTKPRLTVDLFQEAAVV